jgi:hypothetical protein
LHDAEVIRQRHDGGEEDDGGQNAEGELCAEGITIFRFDDVAEEKFGAVAGEAEESSDLSGQPIEGNFAGTGSKNEQGKNDLQRRAPQHHAPGKATAVIGH